MKVGDYVYIPRIGRRCQITSIDKDYNGVWVRLDDEGCCEAWHTLNEVELIPVLPLDPRTEAKV
jgi:hypothetical protein